MERIKQQALEALKAHGLESETDADYIDEELILSYLAEAEDVDEATINEYGTKEVDEATLAELGVEKDAVAKGLNFYVIYGHSAAPFGQLLYFMIVNDRNVCTNVKRKMRSPNYRPIGHCTNGRLKYQIYGWYPHVPA